MAEYDTPTAETGVASRVSSLARAGVSYALFGAGVLLLYAFFATSVPALPGVGVAELVPTVVAPTEAQNRYVDVGPLALGVVAASVAVWLR